MQHCYLVAVFWRARLQAIDGVRFWDEAMHESDVRGLAVQVEAHMKRTNGHEFYPELTAMVEFVELYAVSANLAHILSTPELWQRHFSSCLNAGKITEVSNFSLHRKP